MKSLRNMNMTQHVTVVTRPKSNSCLNHVYTTHGHFITNISVPCIGLSDHLPVFLCRNYVKLNLESGHKRINYLDFKNLQRLCSLTSRTPHGTVHLCLTMLTTRWMRLSWFYVRLLKNIFLEKQRRVEKIKQPAWIDENIMSAIKKRDRELKIARKTNCPNDWSKYKRTKCYVTNWWENLSKCICNSLSMTTKETQKKFEGAEISHQVSEVEESHRTQKGRWYSWDGHFCNGEYVKWVFCKYCSRT